MEEKHEIYYKVRLAILVAIVGLLIATIGWLAGVNGRVNSVAKQIDSEKTAISSLNTLVASLTAKVDDITLKASRLSNNIKVNLPTLSSTYISIQSMKYTTILKNAPLTVSSSAILDTISSTDIKSFKSILEGTGAYEITEYNGMYNLAYQNNFGTTYSIQIVSSPYPDRVMDLVKKLRSLGQPAFEINYANQSGLFIGVFPTYSQAKEYASSISSTSILSIVGTGPKNWLPRKIP